MRLASLAGRIVSLVPSQTELLYDLGLDSEVVGITKFCIHPHVWFQSKSRVGGTKNVDIERVKALKPDLIIANKEENVREQVAELAVHFPVYTSDVHDLPTALQMMAHVAELVGKKQKAEQINERTRTSFVALTKFAKPVKTCYLIWREPFMTVGGDTFINDMLERCSMENIFKNETRYPQITNEEMTKLDCSLILLSSEPYPFKEKHIAEIKDLLNVPVILVDGEMFSWYGSRLLQSAEYFRQLQQSLSIL